MDVDLSFDEDAVRITVSDDGAGGPPAPRTGGYGLAAMGERINLVGGTLYVGPGAECGWTVRAVLPLPGDRP